MRPTNTLQPTKIDRSNFMLAAMAVRPYSDFGPAQLQKFFFLLDERPLDSSILKDRYFNFSSYHYGPFDKAVYVQFEELAEEGLAHVYFTGPSNTDRRFALTHKGAEKAKNAVKRLSKKTREYIFSISEWVQTTEFYDMLAAIYDEFPESAQDSVVRGPVARRLERGNVTRAP